MFVLESLFGKKLPVPYTIPNYWIRLYRKKIDHEIFLDEGVRRYPARISEIVFCQTLADAQQDVDFGPLNGFGGLWNQFSQTVWVVLSMCRRVS